MRSAEPARDGAPVRDITTPARACRLPGVRMAGFRAHATDLVNLRLVPHPAVTVFIDFGSGRDGASLAMAALAAAGLLCYGTSLFLLPPPAADGRAG